MDDKNQKHACYRRNDFVSWELVRDEHGGQDHVLVTNRWGGEWLMTVEEFDITFKTV